MGNERPGYYDLEDIKASVAASIDELIPSIFPEAKRQGASWRVGSLRGEKGCSLAISRRRHNAGVYVDHATSEKGDIFHLVSDARGIGFRAAVEWLAEWFNIAPVEVPFARPAKEEDRTIKWPEGLLDLGDEAEAYLVSRGLSKETAEKYGCKCREGWIYFPRFDFSGELTGLKKWSLDGKKRIEQITGSRSNLFGTQYATPDLCRGKVVITEGEWDAMSFAEAGVPAVSVPGGSSNNKWIELDYEYLSYFQVIYLSLDHDPHGSDQAKAVESSTKQILTRLGKDRVRVVSLPEKDANETLVKRGPEALRKALGNATDQSLGDICAPDELKDAVLGLFRGDDNEGGIPCFMNGFHMEFRPHEHTVWFGLTSHGKSSIVQNQVAYQASLGHPTLVASFEQQPQLTFYSIMRNYACNKNIHMGGHFDRVYNELAEYVYVWRDMDRQDPKRVLGVFELAHRKMGITNFVIDNVMTLKMDRDNYQNQAEVAEEFRSFVSKYPIHLHVVQHPRKPLDGGASPPSEFEVRGASEWIDAAWNVIVVWKDKGKIARMEEMRHDPTIDVDDLKAFDKAVADGRLICQKQRARPELPSCKFWFDRETYRFTEERRHPEPWCDNVEW